MNDHASFLATDARLGIWSRYPDVTEDEDLATDSYACYHATRDFVEYLRKQGVDALYVEANFEHPMAGRHWWVRVGDTDYDWTARQYHNLEHPPAPEHADIACPLMWPAGEPHPIVGAYEVEQISSEPEVIDDLSKTIRRYTLEILERKDF